MNLHKHPTSIKLKCLMAAPFLILVGALLLPSAFLIAQARPMVDISLHPSGDSAVAITNLTASPAYFNSTTGSVTVSYTLSGDTAPVKLEVLNASAQVVRTTDAGSKAPGSYTIVWDGKNDSGAAVGEGGYTLRLTAGGSSYTFVTKWGSIGTGDGQFQSPRGIAVDSSGNVYVADNDNHRIQKFSSTGQFLAKWGSEGTGDGQFQTPMDVAVDGSGNVYVVDKGNNRIQKFTASGSFITKWGAKGAGNGQFDAPFGIAVDSSGNVYVSEAVNTRIQKFTSSGTYLTQWGTWGTANGQFWDIRGIGIDSSGNVYVADFSVLYRIQKFTASGTFIAKWGSYGSGDEQFASPWGVAVDSSDNIYVTDWGNDRVQKFTASGQFLTKWGSSGTGDGQFLGPYGIDVDSSGNVYVADSGNRRVQKFAPAQASVTVDNTPPTVPTNLAKTTPDNDTTPTFTWTAATDALSGIDRYEARVDSDAFSNIGNVTTYTQATALSTGSHTFQVRAVDKVGNIGTAASRSFTISPPPIAVPGVSGWGLGVMAALLVLIALWGTRRWGRAPAHRQ